LETLPTSTPDARTNWPAADRWHCEDRRVAGRAVEPHLTEHHDDDRSERSSTNAKAPSLMAVPVISWVDRVLPELTALEYSIPEETGIGMGGEQ
jgi:hypothetical protein